MSDTVIFERRWFMCDYARLRVFNRDEFSLWLDALGRLGYNGLGLYLEGAFDFTSIPGVLREGVMTPADAKWIVDACVSRGIYVFPLTNIVGHMEHFFKQERFSDLLMKDTRLTQLNFLDDRAEAFAMNILHEFTRHFPCGMIHIGGDETTLTEENKALYAQFIAKICQNLLNEGIKPAVWNDMFWMDQPLCEYLDRRTVIFDWNYNGHRPESVEFFQQAGFSDIVVCPSDNGWEHFITYQHTSGWLKAREDLPVQPDEIEAFLEDGRKYGVTDGMLTNWNNEHGRSIWAQWSTIARAGLYMNGKLKSQEQDDDAIEMALFGRITPYTKITKLIQEEIPFSYFGRNLLYSLYFRSSILPLFNSVKTSNYVPPHDYRATAAKVEALLDEWIPENAFEHNCAMAMYGVAGTLRVAAAVLDAMNMYDKYRIAAQIQFDSPDSAALIVERVSARFSVAAAELRAFASAFGRTIEGTGHNKRDLDFLLGTAGIYESVANMLDKGNTTMARIPLLRFESILEHAVNGKDLYL